MAALLPADPVSLGSLSFELPGCEAVRTRPADTVHNARQTGLGGGGPWATVFTALSWGSWGDAGVLVWRRMAEMRTVAVLR